MNNGIGTLPTTTRAAEYIGGGEIVLHDVPLPAPGTGEISVRIKACGLCSSETLRWYVDDKAPFVLGHEPVGVVVAVGKNTEFTPGQRVFVHHHAACMRCERCKRGDYVQCDTWRTSKLYPGGLSQFATVPQINVQHDVLALPESISDDHATLIEPLATVVKSVRRSGLRAGNSVLVVGLGAMGMLHSVLARQRGARSVMGADRSQFRLHKAGEFGVQQTIDVAAAPLHRQILELTAGEGAHIVFVTPASLKALQASLGCVARGGTLVVFTPLAPNELWPINIHDVFFKDINIVTSYSAGPDDTRVALQLLADGLAVDGLFTHRFNLDQVQQAYAALQDVEASLKVIVYP